MPERLRAFLENNDWFRHISLSNEDKERLFVLLEGDFLADFLEQIIRQSEDILSIDPALSRRTILETAAQHIMDDLGAAAASIRLFDPKSFKMLNYGAAGLKELNWSPALPVNESIAGRVVSENKSILLPSIALDPHFQDKKLTCRKGFESLMAVPLRMPSFVGSSGEILGSLQIYFRENNRHFSRQEVLRAEMLARRVSYVMVKKRILALKALGDKKERISDKIFIKLSNREGVKLKDFFHLILPELDSLITLHSCSLFTLSDDQKNIHLEASYPAGSAYHEDGYLFTVDHHDYFWATVHGSKENADMPHERIDSSYVLIKDPVRSELLSGGLRKFTQEQDINSVLLVPLRAATETRHILVFFATQQRQYFTEDEIELLTFFGKEIMKAVRLEFLGDMLHDFKNPAVAVAGLAARARKMLDCDDLETMRPRLIKYLDVVARETARLQDLALTMTGEGREEELALGILASERYMLNSYAISEAKNCPIEVRSPECEQDIMVRCTRYGLERVLDNLLHNATKAIPSQGGFIALHCGRCGDMACLTIENSGAMPDEEIARLKSGNSHGRGLNIVSRFVEKNHGQLEVRSLGSTTTFAIKLPLCQ